MPRRAPRIRRTPEAARDHILAAATAVFARALPDAVGLREIAEEAGTSHGLVTHYFGTYERLISEVIERRLAAMRELAFTRLAGATFTPDESPLLDVLLELLDDRALTRLIAWALLSDRGAGVVGRPGQLGRLVDAMHARIATVDPRVKIPRARLELSIVAAISLVAGWSLAGPALERALGRTIERSELRRELQRMLRAYTLS